MESPARGTRRRRARLGLALALFVWSGCGDAPQERAAENIQGAAGPATTEANAPPSEPTPPNVIVITLDTTRADALGAYGQALPTSPAFDRLAARGVLFEQAGSTNPETLPSHATLFTGKWPFTHGIRANPGQVLDPRHSTLAEILKAEGYRTGAEIAAQVLRADTGITQGVDRIHDAESPGVQLKRVREGAGSRTVAMRTGADITRRGIDFLDGRAPFYLWLHYFDAHDPYVPGRDERQRIPASDYHGAVATADTGLARLLDELDRRGLTDQTLIVVTSDHGEGLGEHDEPTHSYFIYETTQRVPLVLAGPGLPQGVRVAEPVRLLDVLPTVLELLALPVPNEVEGVSLLPLARGGSLPAPLPSYSEASRFSATLGLPMLRSYREGRWKYLHKVNPELYDLEADPGETRNRIDDEPEIAERLRGKLAALVASGARVGEGAVAVAPETAAQLTALGYATQPPAREGDDPLELWGDDPTTKIGDTRLLSEAQGLIGRKEWTEAWKRLEPALARNPESDYVRSLSARTLIGLGRPSQAIPLLTAILSDSPCESDALDAIAGQLRAAKRYAELVAVHARAYDHCPDYFDNTNNYAWVLATLPEASVRDGARAVEILRPAIAARPDAPPTVLDTLAAAQAEAGDFADAVATQRDAITKLRAARADPRLVRVLEGHLAEFEAGRPIREE